MKLEALVEDITTAQVDAIVNAANPHLHHGGGVARAIALAAGPELTTESEQAEFVPTGSAVATSAGLLSCRYVIHAVGPVWSGGSEGEPALLDSAYRSSMTLAEQLGCTSIAFPSISTGIFGFPLERAAPIAVDAVRDELSRCLSVERARFCLFSSQDLEVFQQLLG